MYYCTMILTSKQHPNPITTSSAEMFLDDDNIFITKLNDNALLRVEQVKEHENMQNLMVLQQLLKQLLYPL